MELRNLRSVGRLMRTATAALLLLAVACVSSGRDFPAGPIPALKPGRTTQAQVRKAFGEPWGCVYRIVGDRVHATLYSIGDFDVSLIATELGGGGHKNASGFNVSLQDWVRDFVC